MFLMMDGNFKLNNLQKKNSQLDPALWDGRGVFRARGDLEEHYSKFKGIKIEVCCSGCIRRRTTLTFPQKGYCRKFEAIENVNSLKYKGQTVTGVIMVFCRHGLVRPDCAVNLKKGELYVFLFRHFYLLFILLLGSSWRIIVCKGHCRTYLLMSD